MCNQSYQINCYFFIKRISEVIVIIFFTFFSLKLASAQQVTHLKHEQWHSFKKVSFNFNGNQAFYIKPKNPLPGKPWVWCARSLNKNASVDSLLLSKGFEVAHIHTTNFYGSPQSLMIWDRYYRYLTGKLKLAPKVALEGFSLGGLNIYNWAEHNPDKVSCIYAVAPVCNIKTVKGWQYKQGISKDWRRLKQSFNFTEKQAVKHSGTLIDHLNGLAAFKVPILHVIGLRDHLVPPDENTFKLVQHYEALGGPAYVYPLTRERQRDHGHQLTIKYPDRWANFVYRNTYPVHKPLPYRKFFHAREGISNALGKFKNGKQATVAFLGGSITHMHGWRNKVCQFLRERFPKTNFHFMNAGIPSLGSLPDAFRLQHDVLDSANVDLMFVEAAVNDQVNGTDSLTQLRALEGIIRHARRVNPDMNIIMMSFADPHKLHDYSEGKKPVTVQNHEQVAAHYHLPSINIAREVYDKIKAGEFSWRYDFKSIHPAAYGQELYFETIKALLWHCIDQYHNGSAPKKEKSYSLPPPIDPENFNRGKYLSIQHAHLNEGWKLIKNWQPANDTPTRPGFVNRPMLVTKKPGASLRLTFSGNAIGLAVVSGPNAGTIKYHIDQGPAHRINLHTRWSHSLYLPWYVLLGSALSKSKHTLHLELAQSKHKQNSKTACHIVYFLVNR